jgi:hypothetical protein
MAERKNTIPDATRYSAATPYLASLIYRFIKTFHWLAIQSLPDHSREAISGLIGPSRSDLAIEHQATVERRTTAHKKSCEVNDK